MSQNEARMPDRLVVGFTAIPYYDTQIVELDNGKEQRNANWSRAKREFTAEFGAFQLADYALLLALFHACLGAAHSFRFKDVTDYRADGDSLPAATGTNPVQLRRVYTSGSLTTYRTITKPVAGRVTVYEGGVAKAGTFDTTTGLFTPTSAWSGAALTWSGEFDTPVRFKSSSLPSTYEAYNAIRAQIELVEVFL